MKISRRHLRKLIIENIKQDLSQHLDDGPLGKHAWPTRNKEKTNVSEPDTEFEKELWIALAKQIGQNSGAELSKLQNNIQNLISLREYPGLFVPAKEKYLYRGMTVKKSWIDNSIGKIPSSGRPDQTRKWHEELYNRYITGKTPPSIGGMKPPKEVTKKFIFKPRKGDNNNTVTSWSKDKIRATAFANSTANNYNKNMSDASDPWIPIVLETNSDQAFFLDMDNFYRYDYLSNWQGEKEFIGFGPIPTTKIYIFFDDDIEIEDRLSTYKMGPHGLEF
tara:strand:+ start:338 stop:1168 length:831 start_codon:yes stop_codon:yes gene_type:complete